MTEVGTMIELILDECLEDIRAKRATVADCLARRPNVAADLAPLLEMALAIAGVPEVRPSEEFKRATRERLLRLSPPTKSNGRMGDLGPRASPVPDTKERV
ncbi:MAG: hypothetical protein HY782_25575 [Chloroflexi bacterium]|nr:hypothetical protein [Chloroflexota bacterium]